MAAPAQAGVAQGAPTGDIATADDGADFRREPGA